MQPLGMSGHKKLSDLLIDAKWPRISRDEVLVLVGSGALCARYGEALRQLSGQDPAAIIENPAPAGLHRFARDAGLLRQES